MVSHVRYFEAVQPRVQALLALGERGNRCTVRCLEPRQFGGHLIELLEPGGIRRGCVQAPARDLFCSGLSALHRGGIGRLPQTHRMLPIADRFLARLGCRQFHARFSEQPVGLGVHLRRAIIGLGQYLLRFSQAADRRELFLGIRLEGRQPLDLGVELALEDQLAVDHILFHAHRIIHGGWYGDSGGGACDHVSLLTLQLRNSRLNRRMEQAGGILDASVDRHQRRPIAALGGKTVGLVFLLDAHGAESCGLHNQPPPAPPALAGVSELKMAHLMHQHRALLEGRQAIKHRTDHDLAGAPESMHAGDVLAGFTIEDAMTHDAREFTHHQPLPGAPASTMLSGPIMPAGPCIWRGPAGEAPARGVPAMPGCAGPPTDGPGAPGTPCPPCICCAIAISRFLCNCPMWAAICARYRPVGSAVSRAAAWWRATCATSSSPSCTITSKLFTIISSSISGAMVNRFLSSIRMRGAFSDPNTFSTRVSKMGVMSSLRPFNCWGGGARRPRMGGGGEWVGL